MPQIKLKDYTQGRLVSTANVQKLTKEGWTVVDGAGNYDTVLMLPPKEEKPAKPPKPTEKKVKE